jgi:hypothetical protein
MKKCITYLALSLVMLTTSCMSKNKPSGGIVEQKQLNARVEAIDHQQRIVTVRRDEDGTLADIKVGPNARNLDQVNVGDHVAMTYTEALAIDVSKADGQELDEKAQVAVKRVPLGAKPSGTITGEYNLSALVEDIDYDTRHVTLRSRDGKLTTLKVGPQATRFNDVKVGDHVNVNYQEALAIAVTSPKG